MQWFEIENEDVVDSPALLIYPDRIEANIRKMIDMVNDPARLRPHVKTYKMREIVEMQLQAGIKKFKCATIAEAEMLCLAGAKDVLMAYQPVGPKVARLVELKKAYPDVRLAALVDNQTNAAFIHESLEASDSPLDIYLDLDTGNHRTGISPDDALELYKACASLERLHVAGLHAYDGHLRNSDFKERKAACDRAFEPVEQLAQQIRTLNDSALEIVAGGSPTFPCHALRDDVICSPGTCLLWDWGYDQLLPDLNFQHAAVVLCRVISKIGNDRLCLDLGHKAIASENPFPRIHFLNYTETEQVGHSEEHLVLQVTDNSTWQVGDAFYGIPIHICPTTALYEETAVVRNHQVVDQWQVIARRRKINY